MAELNTGLDAGDELNRFGDYVGFPHGVADETARDDITGPLEGKPVWFDETAGDNGELKEWTDGTTEAIVGVLYTYQYYGDSQYGPFVDGSRDATVKMGGSVVLDVTDLGVAVNAGDTIGQNGEILVMTDPTADNLVAARVR